MPATLLLSLLLSLVILSGFLVQPAHAFLPTRLQYAQLNARLLGLTFPIAEAQGWFSVFPIDQNFLFSDNRCGHIECYPSQATLTLNCTAGRVEFVHLWYNMTARAFQLIGGSQTLIPNYPALVTFVDCFWSEPWVLPPIVPVSPADMARPQPVVTATNSGPSSDL